MPKQVKEYYILYDEGCDASKGIEFYQLKQGIYHPIKRAADDLIQSAVLPGFQFRIEDLYCRPELEQMCLDPVYQDFVFPAHQLEKNRADNAEQQIIKLQAILDQKIKG